MRGHENYGTEQRDDFETDKYGDMDKSEQLCETLFCLKC